jgi:hypothetical protein
VSRGAVNIGAVGVATGAALEWIAPLWGVLPDWLRVIASANEPMMIGGVALLIGGAIAGRRLRGTREEREPVTMEAPPRE